MPFMISIYLLPDYLLYGNFLDAAIAIYHDIHALGRRGYSLSVERIAGDFLHIAAICHLVNTCRVILNDVSKVFPDGRFICPSSVHASF